MVFQEYSLHGILESLIERLLYQMRRYLFKRYPVSEDTKPQGLLKS